MVRTNGEFLDKVAANRPGAQLEITTRWARCTPR